MSTEQKKDFVISVLGDSNTLIVPDAVRWNLSAADELLDKKEEMIGEYAAATIGLKLDKKKIPQKKQTTQSKKIRPAKETVWKLPYLDDEDLLKHFKMNTTGRSIIVSEPIYDMAFLWRFHDGYRLDGSIQRNIETKVEFTCGRKRTTLLLDTNDYYDSQEDEAKALEAIKNNDAFRKYVRGISKLNKLLKMNEYEKALLTNGYIYGKAALLIEYDLDYTDPKAMPRAITVLNPLRIGRVFYYADDYELAGIEYLDTDPTIIEAERLIYFANRDYHISPKTLYHGMSALESSIDIAETNILNNQTNIKEINRRLWAAFIILKYMGKRTEDVIEFIKNYKVGQPIISNKDFEAQVVEVGHDLQQLLEQMEKSDKKIARNLNVPQLLSGFDDLQSQATAGGVLHGWLSSVIETLRTILRNVFEPQWINRMLRRLMYLNGDTVESLNNTLDSELQNGGVPSEKPQPPINPALMHPLVQPLAKNLANSPNQPLLKPTQDPKQNQKEGKKPIEDILITNIPEELDQEGNPPIKVEDLRFKIKLHHENFSTSTELDKASAMVAYKNGGILDTELVLKEIDREEYIPHMASVEQQNQMMFNTAQAANAQANMDQAHQQGFEKGQKSPPVVAGKQGTSKRASGNSVGSNKTMRN